MYNNKNKKVMKKIKTYIPVLLVALIFTGIGILKAQQEDHQDKYLNALFQNNEEESINDLPFNTAAIASEALFQKLEKNYFSKEKEEQVAPLPFDAHKMAEQYRFEKAQKKVFHLEEECEIDDLPPAVKKFMTEYQHTLLAVAKDK